MANTLESELKLNISSILQLNNISDIEYKSIIDQTEFQIPGLFECFLILSALCIFSVGLVGNILVVLVVFKNQHMRTITNMFIVNLAIGDVMVIVIALPPTILTDVTGNWYFGETMCQIIPYVQYISVSVSVLTLTSISYERYYAICYPLKFMATKFRAKVIILIVWILSVLFNLPYPIHITMNYDNETNTYYCVPTWSIIYQNIYDTFIAIILYVLPMILIAYTYTRVIKVLWRIDKSIAWDKTSESSTNKIDKNDKSKNNYFEKNRKETNSSTQENSKQVTFTTACGSSVAKSKMMNQLNARRKAAKMLISVAAMFAICYFPIHVLNIVRFVYPESLFLNNYAHIMYKIAHLLVYINSSVNPLIYNFMSDNFRKEFQAVLTCGKVKSISKSNNRTLALRNPNCANKVNNACDRNRTSEQQLKPNPANKSSGTINKPNILEAPGNILIIKEANEEEAFLKEDVPV